MKTRTPLFQAASALLLLAALAITGCSSTPKIHSLYDDSADFGSFRTYNFFDNAGPRRGAYGTMFSNLMIVAITKEMESRGYTMSEDPDLLLNFNAVFQDKTKITTSPAMGGYYGYRHGYYNSWGGYGYGYATETRVSQYTQGTYNIDIVDARKMQLVWEAVSSSRLSDSDMDTLPERVKAGVPRAFTNYPFVAGNPVPVNAK